MPEAGLTQEKASLELNERERMMSWQNSKCFPHLQKGFEKNHVTVYKWIALIAFSPSVIDLKY